MIEENKDLPVVEEGNEVADNSPAIDVGTKLKDSVNYTAAPTVTTVSKPDENTLNTFLAPSRDTIDNYNLTDAKKAEVESEIKSGLTLYDSLKDTPVGQALRTLDLSNVDWKNGPSGGLVTIDFDEAKISEAILNDDIGKDYKVRLMKGLNVLRNAKARGLKVIRADDGRYWLESNVDGKRTYAVNGLLAIKEVIDRYNGKAPNDVEDEDDGMSDSAIPDIIDNDGESKQKQESDEVEGDEIVVPAKFEMTEAEKWYIGAFIGDAATTVAGVATKAVGGSAISFIGGLGSIAAYARGDYLSGKSSGEMWKNALARLAIEGIEAASIVPASMISALRAGSPVIKFLKRGMQFLMVGNTIDVAYKTRWKDLYNKVTTDPTSLSVDDWRELTRVFTTLVSLGGAASTHVSGRKNMRKAAVENNVKISRNKSDIKKNAMEPEVSIPSKKEAIKVQKNKDAGFKKAEEINKNVRVKADNKLNKTKAEIEAARDAEVNMLAKEVEANTGEIKNVSKLFPYVGPGAKPKPKPGIPRKGPGGLKKKPSDKKPLVRPKKKDKIEAQRKKQAEAKIERVKEEKIKVLKEKNKKLNEAIDAKNKEANSKIEKGKLVAKKRKENVDNIKKKAEDKVKKIALKERAEKIEGVAGKRREKVKKVQEDIKNKDAKMKKEEDKVKKIFGENTGNKIIKKAKEKAGYKEPPKSNVTKEELDKLTNKKKVLESSLKLKKKQIKKGKKTDSSIDKKRKLVEKRKIEKELKETKEAISKNPEKKSNIVVRGARNINRRLDAAGTVLTPRGRFSNFAAMKSVANSDWPIVGRGKDHYIPKGKNADVFLRDAKISQKNIDKLTDAEKTRLIRYIKYSGKFKKHDGGKLNAMPKLIKRKVYKAEGGIKTDDGRIYLLPGGGESSVPTKYWMYPENNKIVYYGDPGGKALGKMSSTNFIKYRKAAEQKIKQEAIKKNKPSIFERVITVGKDFKYLPDATYYNADGTVNTSGKRTPWFTTTDANGRVVRFKTEGAADALNVNFNYDDGSVGNISDTSPFDMGEEVVLHAKNPVAPEGSGVGVVNNPGIVELTEKQKAEIAEAEAAAKTKAEKEAAIKAINDKYNKLRAQYGYVPKDEPAPDYLGWFDNIKPSDILGLFNNKLISRSYTSTPTVTAAMQTNPLTNMPGYSQAERSLSLNPRIDSSDSFAKYAYNNRANDRMVEGKNSLVAKNAQNFFQQRARQLAISNQNRQIAANAINRDNMIEDQNERASAASWVAAKKSQMDKSDKLVGNIMNGGTRLVGKYYNKKYNDKFIDEKNNLSALLNTYNTEYMPAILEASNKGDVSGIRAIKNRYMEQYKIDPDYIKNRLYEIDSKLI